MFTGIVAAVGRIESISPLGASADAGVRLTVQAGGLDLADVALGDSIAIQGACMTVIEKTEAGFDVAAYEVLPDEPARLEACLRHWLAQRVELVVTVGGTGVGPRDMTVETVRPLLDAELPGLMEAARAFGQARTPYAILSRGVAGLSGNSVVCTFPGSRRGAEETLAAILPGLAHLIDVCRIARPHVGGYE